MVLVRYRNKERQTNIHATPTNTLVRQARIYVSHRICVCCVGSRATLLFFSHIVEALWLNELFFNEAALCPRRRCSSPVVLRKTWRTRVSLTATGLFLFFLPHHRPHTPKRVLFMSRQARRSPPPFSLSACAPPRGCTEGSGKKRTRHRLFDSSPLLATTSLSLRCPGETVIDVRINREKDAWYSLFFPFSTLLSCSRSRFPLFPSFLAIWKPADVGLTFPTAEIHLA